MKAVSDSSPTHYPVLIGEDRVLRALFGTVQVPADVIQELAHSRSPEVVREWAANLPPWIEVADQGSSLADPKLGPGESAAIAMAIDRSVDLFLIDERYGTRLARDLELTTVGTVGILAAVDGRGLVSLRASFDGQRATSFRGPDGLMEELLRMDESRRRTATPSPLPSQGKVGDLPRAFPRDSRRFDTGRCRRVSIHDCDRHQGNGFHGFDGLREAVMHSSRIRLKTSRAVA